MATPIRSLDTLIQQNVYGDIYIHGAKIDTDDAAITRQYLNDSIYLAIQNFKYNDLELSSLPIIRNAIDNDTSIILKIKEYAKAADINEEKFIQTIVKLFDNKETDTTNSLHTIINYFLDNNNETIDILKDRIIKTVETNPVTDFYKDFVLALLQNDNAAKTHIKSRVIELINTDNDFKNQIKNLFLILANNNNDFYSAMRSLFLKYITDDVLSKETLKNFTIALVNSDTDTQTAIINLVSNMINNSAQIKSDIKNSIITLFQTDSDVITAVMQLITNDDRFKNKIINLINTDSDVINTVINFIKTRPEVNSFIQNLIDESIIALKDSVTNDLDTLAKLANAINNDPNYYVTINSALDTKVDKITNKGLSTNDFTDELKSKLELIEDNANKYIHPMTSGNLHIPSGGTTGKILRWSSDGVAVWGDDKDTVYVHPNTTGNRHIPEGGLPTQILRWNYDGAAKWDNETKYDLATPAMAGLMSGEDKAKLDTIATMMGIS